MKTISYTTPLVKEGQHVLVQLELVAGPDGCLPISDGIALLPAALARAGGSVRAFDGPPPIESVIGDGLLRKRAVTAELDAADARARKNLAEKALSKALEEHDRRLEELRREVRTGARFEMILNRIAPKFAAAKYLLDKHLPEGSPLAEFVAELDDLSPMCPYRLAGAPCVLDFGHEHGEEDESQEWQPGTAHESTEGVRFSAAEAGDF